MIKISGKRIRLFFDLAQEAAIQLNLLGDGIVDVTFLSKKEMQELNARMRGIDKPTDVLSFPMLDKVTQLVKQNYPYDYDSRLKAVRIGSIAICDQIAAEQAKEYGHSLMRERAYLFVHGLLHLLGYDHESEEQRAQMRVAEENILKSKGITK